jgi:PAS domain S-box-containing protein
VGIVKDVTNNKGREDTLSQKELELLSRLYRLSANEEPLQKTMGRIAAEIENVFACPIGDGNRSSCQVLLKGDSFGEAMNHDLLQAGAPIFVDGREAGSVEFFCTGGSSECPEVTERIRSSGIIDMVAEHIGLLAMKEQQREEIAEARRLRNHILKTSLDGFWLLDDSGRFTDVNDAYLAMSGYGREEFLQLSLSDILVEEERGATQGRIDTLLVNGKGRFRMWHKRKDGSHFHLEVSASVMADPDDSGNLSIVCFCRDSTEKEKEKRRIEGLLQEKDLLLKEIHHRVKNDLSFIHSILRLQESMQESIEESSCTAMAEGSSESPLTDAQNRIALVMQVYEELYEGSSVTAVQSDHLLARISSQLGKGNYGCSPTFDIETSPFTIPARMGIAVGTLINEMVTNSLKYGAPTDGDSPAIRIELKEELIQDELDEELPIGAGEPLGRRSLRILVRDHGPGFPRDVLEGSRTGFGLTVIDALAHQYDGKMELANRPGAEICVTISTQSP